MQTQNNHVQPYDPFVDEEGQTGVVSYHDNTALQAVSLSYYADPNSEYPQHMAQLELLPFDEDTKLEVLDAYNGAEPQDLSTFVNMKVLIHGAVLWWYPPFIGKFDASKGEKAEVKPGYHKILMLAELEDAPGKKFVIGTSSVTVGQTCVYLMKTKGWYLFRDLTTGTLTPKWFKFTRANSQAPYRMQNIARMESQGNKK